MGYVAAKSVHRLWAITRRNNAWPSALSLGNMLKTILTSSPPSLLVMNLEFMVSTLGRSSNHLCRGRQTHRDPREHDKLEIISDRCWYLETKNTVHKWFLPPGQTTNGEMLFRRPYPTEGKKFCANVQSSGAKIPVPCTVRCPPIHLSLCASFWLQRKRQSAPTHRTGQTPPPCNYSLFPKMKLKLKVRRFEGIEEIQAEPQHVMKMPTQNNTH
jgi:hypothetical protein